MRCFFVLRNCLCKFFSLVLSIYRSNCQELMLTRETLSLQHFCGVLSLMIFGILEAAVFAIYQQFVVLFLVELNVDDNFM